MRVRRCSRAGGPYKVRPAPSEPLGFSFEAGTPQFEQMAGFVAAIEYLDSIGGFDVIVPYEEALGERFLQGLPDAYVLYGPQTMADRVATFGFNLPGTDAHDVAEELIARRINAGAGNYYSPGVVEAYGIDSAVRIGISHYNTEAEVDTLPRRARGDRVVVRKRITTPAIRRRRERPGARRCRSAVL